MSQAQDHWATVYRTKDPENVSWYQVTPEPSLLALERFGADPSSSVIDIGVGASHLVDVLLERGWWDVTVLDIAAPALEAAKVRLGSSAGKAHWEVADITQFVTLLARKAATRGGLAASNHNRRSPDRSS